MRKKYKMALWLTLLVLGALFLGFAPAGASEGAPVAVLKIKGALDGGTKSYVRYALQEAENLQAQAVIIELDTPGGYIDAAEGIRRLLDEFSAPVIAWVNPNAISAGAYLALAADEIYMAPGSTMGAAEPRYLGLSTVDEKELSYWEKEMATLAERRGRDPKVASAMVRKEIAISGLVKEGELLTLTSLEAQDAGYAEGVAETLSEVLEASGLAGASLTAFEPRATDALVGFTVNPIVGTILLMVGLGGLIIEVLTPGFGLAGILSIAAFALYFGGNIAAQMAEYWVLILFVIGIVFLLVEAFIPGFGVFGITGLIATFASVILAAVSVKTGLVMLLVAFVLAGVTSYFLVRFLGRRGALRHIILSTEARSELGYVSSSDKKHLVGLQGVATTILRPSGTATIEGRLVDVITEGSFIPAGDKIVVEKVEGARVVVRKAD